MKKYLAAMILTIASVSFAACGTSEEKQAETTETAKETEDAVFSEENTYQEMPKISSITFYADNWYLDGDMDNTCIRIEETSTWEMSNADGMVSGTVEANENETALQLVNENEEVVAEIHVENDDEMHVDVKNEEFMQLPEHCHFVREMSCY